MASIKGYKKALTTKREGFKVSLIIQNDYIEIPNFLNSFSTTDAGTGM